jgi:hypothetical protein
MNSPIVINTFVISEPILIFIDVILIVLEEFYHTMSNIVFWIYSGLFALYRFSVEIH